jgi:hypothetical protein
LNELTLYLNRQQADDVNALVTLLTTTATLRVLRVRMVTLSFGKPWDTDCILAALRSNGSLRTVTLSKGSKKRLPGGVTTWTRLSTAYLERNLVLPNLLERVSKIDPNHDGSTTTSESPLVAETMTDLAFGSDTVCGGAASPAHGSALDEVGLVADGLGIHGFVALLFAKTSRFGA